MESASAKTLRQVVIGVDEQKNKKMFYVKKWTVDNKEVLIYVDKNGNAVDGVDITFCPNGETLLTVKSEGRTYKVGKNPTIFTEVGEDGKFTYEAASAKPRRKI